MIVGQEKPLLGDLAHYGVKGMRWGVRREAARNFKSFQKQQALRSSSVSWEMSEAQYKKLSSAPVKLGRDFSRITHNGNTKLRDFAYVTNNDTDRDIYRAFFGPEASNPKKSKSELTIKTSKEAISPGEKVRVDTYIKTLDQHLKKDKALASQLQNTFSGPDAARALNTREIGLRTYMQFSQSQHMGTKLHTDYFDSLRKKGYTAVVDDADAKIVSNTPVILFPKESNAKVTEIKPITKEDVLKAKLNAKFIP